MTHTFSVDVDYALAGIPAPEKKAELTVNLIPHTDTASRMTDRPMVIVVPGGAYAFCSDREAEPIALKLMAQGFHTAILRYSVAPNRYPAAALELAWSIRMIRERAKEYHVKPDCVAVMGFSAGGHLAGTLGTLWREPVFEKVLGGEISLRPDLQLLCYPVLTMGEFTHEGSRENLLGSPEPCEAMSLETRVTPETPPTFLWHTAEDGAVPVENSLMYAAACRRNGVPFELHIYEKGGHGLSTCERTSATGPEHFVPDNAGWIDLAGRFISRHGWKE